MNKKQRREAAQAKRLAFEEQVRISGLEAQRKDKEHRAAEAEFQKAEDARKRSPEYKRKQAERAKREERRLADKEKLERARRFSQAVLEGLPEDEAQALEAM